jgi:prepilin-type processing-associated H-X9-DG protein
VRWFARRSAATLVELLVVASVLAAVVGLTLSAVQKVRGAAARVACQNNVRQLALALHQRHDAAGRLPPGTVGPRADRHRHMGWVTHLLPYLDQPALWGQAEAAYRSTPSFSQRPGHPGLSHVLPVAGCPADDRTRSAQRYLNLKVAVGSFLGVGGRGYDSRDGVLYADSAVRLTDIRDGLSATLMIGERPACADIRFGWWYAGIGQNQSGAMDHWLGASHENRTGRAVTDPRCPPGPYPFRRGNPASVCSAFHFWSLHPGGANFALADGSVRFLPYAADPVLPALATRAGGEPAPDVP